MEPTSSSSSSSRKRSRATDAQCQYVDKLSGVRCTKGSFHAGLHSFDTVSVSSDINAWKNAWPRSLCLEFADGESEVDFGEAELLGKYNQAAEIANRRPVYEHATASAVLAFGRDNTWAVRWSAGSQAVALQLKDACRTPDRSKRSWHRMRADGRLEDIVGLRCALAEAEEEVEAAAAGATASSAEAGLEAASGAPAEAQTAAFIEGEDDDDDEYEWWPETLEATIVEEGE